MTDAQYHVLQEWFKTYVRSFREPDPADQENLDLKEQHTRRVCEAARRIATGLGLTDNDRRLATVTALFHDLGRFRQYREFRSFRDADSVNHARLSLLELHGRRILHGLPAAERRLIGRAIILHNRISLPGRLDPATLLHCQLIRDADKVDILRVMAEHFRMPAGRRNPVVTLGLESDGEVREEVYNRLFAGRGMSYTAMRNTNEFKVLLLSWVFDCHFRPTFELLREQNDISSIAASLPDTPAARRARDFALAAIDHRLREPG